MPEKQARRQPRGRIACRVALAVAAAGVGATMLASCGDDQAATASAPSITAASTDPATPTHPRTDSTAAPGPTTAADRPESPEPTTPTPPEQPGTTSPPTTSALPGANQPEHQASDDHASAAVNASTVGEALGDDSAELVSRISHVALLPWREGFLEVGHLVVDEDRADLTRLFSRTSADGLDWSPLERLPIRLPDPHNDGLNTWPYRRGWSAGLSVIAASDGEHLVLLMLGEDTVVAITSDLTRWETFEIPAPSIEGLPDGVTAEPSMIDLAIGSEGWLLLREVQLGVDPWEIAPADIRETARYIQLGDPDYVGGEYVQGESRGLEIDWATEQQEPSDPYLSRFVTWEELGIDEDTYRDYGWVHFANKPYTPSWLASGEAWVAEWGNVPVRNSLPDVDGGFWSEVVGTDAGYIARSNWGEGGYPQVAGPEYFSADGSYWVPGDNPILGKLPYSGVMSVVTDGVMLNGRSYSPGFVTLSESLLWLGDPTGTNWRPVELPGLPEGSRFDLRYSRGGAVVEGGPSEDDSSVEWVMASRDGVNWLLLEHPSDGDLRVFAVNGNVMLAFDPQGNPHRFLLP